MGGLAPTAEDAIQIKTDDIKPGGGNAITKESEVDIKAAGDKDLDNVILGLKVGDTQALTAFTIDSTSILAYQDAAVGTIFTNAFTGSTASGEKWIGFSIPADKLPDQGNGKLKKKFKTTLTLSPVTLVKPNFQIVPVVVAFSEADLTGGHYWMGFSLIRQP